MTPNNAEVYEPPTIKVVKVEGSEVIAGGGSGADWGGPSF